MQIKFLDERLTEFKFEPSTELSAGYDLRACVDEDTWIVPGGQEKIRTGIALNMMTKEIEREMTNDTRLSLVPCAIILPRSGLGCKGIKPRNSPGLIDTDYQGEIVVCLYNEGNDSICIHPMDRIAQLVFMVALHPLMEIVTEFSDVKARGENGFGSTGLQ